MNKLLCIVSNGDYGVRINLPMKHTHPAAKVTRWAILIVCLLTVAFFYIYWNYPFSGNWNDILLNFSFTFVALLAAGIATLNYQHFKHGEPLRRVWMYLTLGLWGWVLAEAIWAFLTLFMEVPDISLADIPWVGAYFFLMAAFLYQFRVITLPTPKEERKWLRIVLVVILVGPVLVTQLERATFSTDQSWLETYLSVFYVFADLMLGLAALRIARAFGRGLLGHAWIGLLAFAISDLFYSILLITGLYAQSAKSDSVLSMLADGLYFDAYLVTALALLTNLLLLHYGPKPTPASEIRLDPS
jgi:hypothetical protein